MKRRCDAIARLPAALAGAGLLLLASGCGRAVPPTPAEPAATNPAPQPHAVRRTVETMLQYDNIRAGQAAKEKVKKAAADHNTDLNEVSADEK